MEKNIFSPNSIMFDSQTYHKYKKGGTNYKKAFSQTGTRAEDITKVKNQIRELANDLIKKKSINKPLHKLAHKQIDGRTRLETLKQTLNTLKEIDYIFSHDIQSSNTDNRPMNYKQFTIKELKAMKKEDNKEYSLFRKFKIYEESQALKEVKDTGKSSSLTEEDTLKLCQVTERNITSKVKGKYLIMDKIKQDIEYFLSFPYIVKVEVLKVLYSDESIDTKSYRWKGAVKEFVDGRYSNEIRIFMIKLGKWYLNTRHINLILIMRYH